MKYKYDSGNSVCQDTHDESCEYLHDCLRCGESQDWEVCRACCRKACLAGEGRE